MSHQEPRQVSAAPLNATRTRHLSAPRHGCVQRGFKHEELNSSQGERLGGEEPKTWECDPVSPNLPDLASKCGLLGNPPVLGTVGRTCGHPTCGFPARAGTESTLMSFPRVPATARIWPSAAALQLRANTSPQHAPETQGALAASTPTCARFPAWCSPTRPRLPNHVGPQ